MSYLTRVGFFLFLGGGIVIVCRFFVCLFCFLFFNTSGTISGSGACKQGLVESGCSSTKKKSGFRTFRDRND